jgi:hypothetical protein
MPSRHMGSGGIALDGGELWQLSLTYRRDNKPLLDNRRCNKKGVLLFSKYDTNIIFCANTTEFLTIILSY